MPEPFKLKLTIARRRLHDTVFGTEKHRGHSFLQGRIGCSFIRIRCSLVDTSSRKRILDNANFSHV